MRIIAVILAFCCTFNLICFATQGACACNHNAPSTGGLEYMLVVVVVVGVACAAAFAHTRLYRSDGARA